MDDSKGDVDDGEALPETLQLLQGYGILGPRECPTGDFRRHEVLISGVDLG